MIALLCVALNIFVLAVFSCGSDHQLQSAMITNTVHQVHKNLINVTIRGQYGLAQPAIQTLVTRSYQSTLRLTK